MLKEKLFRSYIIELLWYTKNDVMYSLKVITLDLIFSLVVHQFIS